MSTMICMFIAIHHYSLVFLETPEISLLKYMNCLSAPGLAWQACLKKTKVELELLANIDMLLMVEKGIRGGIYQGIHRYTKANKKYVKSYVKSIESSFIEYLVANNLYGWAMPQKLPKNGFKWVKNLSQFNESFIGNYDENSDIGYFLKVDINYREKLFNLHKDLSFLPDFLSLKTSLKSWISIKKSTQSNSI